MNVSKHQFNVLFLLLTKVQFFKWHLLRDSCSNTRLLVTVGKRTISANRISNWLCTLSRAIKMKMFFTKKKKSKLNKSINKKNSTLLRFFVVVVDVLFNYFGINFKFCCYSLDCKYVYVSFIVGLSVCVWMW